MLYIGCLGFVGVGGHVLGRRITAQDKVEIRVQIRTEVKDALLDTVILVDGVPIHSATNVSVKDFYFFNC